MSAQEMLRTGFDPKKLMAALTIFAREVGGEGLKRLLIVAEGDIVYTGPLIHDPQQLGRSTRILTSAVYGVMLRAGLHPQVEELEVLDILRGQSSYAAIGGVDSLTPFLRNGGPPDPESAWNRLGYEMTLAGRRPLSEWLQAEIPSAKDWHQFSWNHFGLLDGVVINGGAGNHLQGVTLTPFELATFGWFAHEAYLGAEWTEWTDWMRPTLDEGYGWTKLAGSFVVADPEHSFMAVAPADGFVIARMGSFPDISSVARLIEGVRDSRKLAPPEPAPMP